MSRPRPVLRFVATFALAYGVFIAPCPGWKGAYATGFRWLAESCLGTSAPRVVHVQGTADAGPLDTQIVTYDPAQADAQGRVKARLLGLDTRSVGWIPTAFLSALILATPVTWIRRLRALALGWAALYLYLLACVRVYIWNETLSDPSATLKALGSGLEETLVVQLGPSFVVPALLWLLVTFRQADLEAALAWIARRRGRT